jgi:RHS repeat-associated protein
VGNRKTAIETVNGQNRSLTYTYDDLYRLTDEAIVDAVNGNRTSHYIYDAVGNRDSKTVNAVTTTYAYDANDRLLTEKVGAATTVSYTYDNNGSTLTKVENGVTTTYTWNDEKRMISATVGNTTTAEYVYNDQGIRVASRVNGVEMRYLLDEGITANVWEEYAPNGTAQANYVYGGDLISQTQANQTSYYLVDALGSTRLLTNTQGQVLNSYGYEAFGQTVNQSGSVDNKYQYVGEQFDGAFGDYYLRQRSYDTNSGRFSRMDMYEGVDRQPLTLNKYIYANSNPAKFVDPSGYFPSMADAMATLMIATRMLVWGTASIYLGGYIGRLVGFSHSVKNPPTDREIANKSNAVDSEQLITHIVSNKLDYQSLLHEDKAAPYSLLKFNFDMPTGPVKPFKYIQDPWENSRAIDVKHFLNSGTRRYLGEGIGLGFELYQAFRSRTTPQQNDKESVFLFEDIKSNFYGSIFSAHYYDLEYDSSEQLAASLRTFMADLSKGRLRGVLNRELRLLKNGN